MCEKITTLSTESDWLSEDRSSMTSIDDEKAKRTTTARTDCFVCLARWVVVRSVDHPCSSCVERKKQRARMVITYLCRCGRCALTRRRARRRTDVLLIFARRLVGGTLGYRRSSFRRCARRRRTKRFFVSFVSSLFSCVYASLCARETVRSVRPTERSRAFSHRSNSYKVGR